VAGFELPGPRAGHASDPRSRAIAAISCLNTVPRPRTGASPEPRPCEAGRHSLQRACEARMTGSEVIRPPRCRASTLRGALRRPCPFRTPKAGGWHRLPRLRPPSGESAASPTRERQPCSRGRPFA
jgi:hypothetical protein